MLIDTFNDNNFNNNNNKNDNTVDYLYNKLKRANLMDFCVFQLNAQWSAVVASIDKRRKTKHLKKIPNEKTRNKNRMPHG